jgi:hypothetical protein
MTPSHADLFTRAQVQELEWLRDHHPKAYVRVKATGILKVRAAPRDGRWPRAACSNGTRARANLAPTIYEMSIVPLGGIFPYSIIKASASISTNMSRCIKRLTSTIEVAGRMW